MNRFKDTTPGPWHIGFGDGSGPNYITSGDVNSMPVNVVVGGATDDWGMDQGIRHAPDRELIAATPDLLKALQDLVAADETFDRLQDEVTMAKRAAGNWRVNPLGHMHPAVTAMRLAKIDRQTAIANALKLLK